MSKKRRYDFVEFVRRWMGPIQQFVTLFILISSIGGYFVHNSYGKNHGAIAISIKTLHYGVADMHETRSKARKAALEACLEGEGDVKPRDCEIAVWFYDSCGALAIDRAAMSTDNAWGADWAGSQKIAEKKALENCERHSRNGNCTLVTSFCSI